MHAHDALVRLFWCGGRVPISHLVAEPSGWKLRRYSVDLDQILFTDEESGMLWEDTLFELQLSGVWSCRAVPM